MTKKFINAARREGQNIYEVSKEIRFQIDLPESKDEYEELLFLLNSIIAKASKCRSLLDQHKELGE